MVSLACDHVANARAALAANPACPQTLPTRFSPDSDPDTRTGPASNPQLPHTVTRPHTDADPPTAATDPHRSTPNSQAPDPEPHPLPACIRSTCLSVWIGDRKVISAREHHHPPSGRRGAGRYCGDDDRRRPDNTDPDSAGTAIRRELSAPRSRAEAGLGGSAGSPTATGGGRMPVAAVAVVRTVRSARAFGVGQLAAKAGAHPEVWCGVLAALPARGRCADLLAQASGTGPTDQAISGATHPWCPPAAHRLAQRNRLTLFWFRAQIASSAASGSPTDRHAAVVESRPGFEILLDRLADDADLGVRAAVAAKEHIPQRVLARLAADPEWQPHRQAAANPSCPSSVLEQLAADDHSMVLATVARNTNSPDQTVQRLAHDDRSTVLFQITSRERCPPAALATLALNNHPTVRASAARHIDCPSATLRQLVDDPHPHVVAAANEHLAAGP